MKGYNYSKDYDALYDFICAWNEALCLVNSEYDLDGRDVCKCKKHNDYNISFKESSGQSSSRMLIFLLKKS